MTAALEADRAIGEAVAAQLGMLDALDADDEGDDGPILLTSYRSGRPWYVDGGTLCGWDGPIVDVLLGVLEPGTETWREPVEFDVYFAGLHLGTEPTRDAALALWQAAWTIAHADDDGDDGDNGEDAEPG